MWLSSNPSKRWAEVFFLLYSLFWIAWVLVIFVPFQLFEHCGNWGYLFVCLATSLPCVLLPLLLPPCKADAGKPLSQRYWVKANLWIAIFSYVGNYFWTHYFFQLLGAAYTFESWRLNGVPICLYLMTHAYFCFYHALSNVLLRRTSHAFKHTPRAVRLTAMAAVVVGLSYATAYGETLTIAAFPYYTFVDRDRMYTVGSFFYAIYFFVSFPMFYIMDEDPLPPARPAGKGAPAKPERWTLARAATDSLAAAMIVTILLDLWRISFGGILEGGGHKGPSGLTWSVPA